MLDQGLEALLLMGLRIDLMDLKGFTDRATCCDIGMKAYML